ncbi:hypothetical protein ACZ87_02555 [Candidatus Erwinia dacicola]|uniref:Uncharacterized protein n=1 Tax=Candidatus Erwinia dacicola TaxID=252393 RepID=A0A328TJJ3_9GAMM|nr:hypothetical protein ACZ87_02555 [Candidatus Erwinia dacicola]
MNNFSTDDTWHITKPDKATNTWNIGDFCWVSNFGIKKNK